MSPYIVNRICQCHRLLEQMLPPPMLSCTTGYGTKVDLSLFLSVGANRRFGRQQIGANVQEFTADAFVASITEPLGISCPTGGACGGETKMCDTAFI